MSQVTIKSKSWDRKHKTMKVYVENTRLHNLIDSWFTENNVNRLRVKSKAWGMLTRAANKIIKAKLVEEFDLVPAHTQFSHYCGCSMCPCSPGFVCRNVKHHTQIGLEVWVEMEITDREMRKVKKIMESDKFKETWEKDLLQNKLAIPVYSR